jgi:hypothetical protein
VSENIFNKQPVNYETLVHNFFDKWPHGKISLLVGHLLYALDEQEEYHYFTDEVYNMQEGQSMLIEFMADLERIKPRKSNSSKPKFDFSKIDEEELE